MSNEDIAPPLHPEQQKEIDDAKAANQVLETLAPANDKTNLLEMGEENSSFISPVSAILMVNLSLASRSVFSAAKELKHIKVNGLDYNAYSPLRRKDKDKSDSDGGIALSAIEASLDVIDYLENSRNVYIGEAENVEKTIKEILDKMVKQVETSLPLAMNEKLGEVTYQEDFLDPAHSETMPIAVTMRDVVKVTGWINSNSDIDPTNAVNPYTIVICLTINSAAFYAEKELHKYLARTQSMLLGLKNKRDVDSEIILGVMMDPKDDILKNVREFKEIILGDDPMFEYKIYTREDLYKFGSKTGWSPLTKNEVDQNLLTIDGDVLYTKYL
jgi:hypothetical protein